MTKLMDDAIDSLRHVPADQQDEVARVVMQLTGRDQPVFEMSAEEEASFEESLAQAARREFATDDQVRAVWAKHGL